MTRPKTIKSLIINSIWLIVLTVLIVDIGIIFGIRIFSSGQSIHLSIIDVIVFLCIALLFSAFMFARYEDLSDAISDLKWFKTEEGKHYLDKQNQKT